MSEVIISMSAPLGKRSKHVLFLGEINGTPNKVEEIVQFHVNDITVTFERKKKSSEVIVNVTT